MDHDPDKDMVTPLQDWNDRMDNIPEVQTAGVENSIASPGAPFRQERQTISPEAQGIARFRSDPLPFDAAQAGSTATGTSAWRFAPDAVSDGASGGSSFPRKQPSPAPFTPTNGPNDNMKHAMGRTRAAMAMNALRSKAQRRSLSEEAGEGFLETGSLSEGRLTERQVQLLTKLRGVVHDRITLASNYRSLVGFSLYVGLYFFSVYTQRDTSVTFDIEQSLLSAFLLPSGEPVEIFSYLRSNILPIFRDATCGNGMCEPPGEYPGIMGTVGCSADCGDYPNVTDIVIIFQDSRVPQGKRSADVPLVAWADSSGLEPKYTFNVYSDNLETWLYDTNVPIVPGENRAVVFRVPDGNVTVRIFQEKQIYEQEYEPQMISQFGPADPRTSLPPPLYQGINYGHVTEALGWNVGVKTQYKFQVENSGTEDPGPYDVIGSEGIRLPIGGSILMTNDAGVIAPLRTVTPCSMPPDQVRTYRTSTNCPFGSINGTCYNFTAVAEDWECPDSFTFEVRRHTPKGVRAPTIKPDTGPPRYVTRNNMLVGAISISQQRWSQGPCYKRCSGKCAEVRQKVLGNLANLEQCKTGQSEAPFGVDPTFLPASSLYDGKVRAADWYDPTEFSSASIPHGFFPVSHFQGQSAAKHDHFNVYLDSRMTMAEAGRAITFLEEGFFFDNLTRTLSISIIMYNPELDAIADTLLQFYISDGGQVHFHYSITSMALAEFINITATGVTAFLVTIGAGFMMYQEFGELSDHWRRKKITRYLTDGWNLIDWLAYISVPLSLWTFLWISEILSSQLQLGDDNGNMPHPLEEPSAEARVFRPDPEKELKLLSLEADIRWYANLLSAYAAWTAFNVLILMFRLFKVLDFQGRLGLITRTFYKSFNDILHFLFLFIFVLVAFAVMGQKLYGRQLDQFKDFPNCLMSLVRLTFAIGDDPYQQMLAANQSLQSFTAVYYLTFFFLSSVVLVNIFLAILLEAFGNVKDNASNSESIFEGLGTLAHYDATLAQQHILKLMRTRQLGLRFLPDEMLLVLLDAWIESEKRAGVQIEDSFGQSFRKKKKRRASWGGRDKDKEEDDITDARVVELPDGSQLTGMQLSALMLSLIAGAPDKMREQQEAKHLHSRLHTNLFKSHSSAGSQVAPAPDNSDQGSQQSDGSPMAASSPGSKARRASATETWWQSVRKGITDIDDSKPQDNPEAAESGQAATSSAFFLSTQSLHNRKLRGIVRSLMSRYGKDLNEDEEEDKNVNFLKLEALQKQLDFFDRYGQFEARFESFMRKYELEHDKVADLASLR